MTTFGVNLTGRSTYAALAGLLAVTLAACEEKPPPATVAPPVTQSAPLPETQPAPQQKPAEPPQAAADRELAAKVKSALLAERSLNANGIDVVVKDGTVTLFGTAETRMRQALAGKVAAGVEGVKSVENKLAVVAGS